MHNTKMMAVAVITVAVAMLLLWCMPGEILLSDGTPVFIMRSPREAQYTIGKDSWTIYRDERGNIMAETDDLYGHKKKKRLASPQQLRIWARAVRYKF